MAQTKITKKKKKKGKGEPLAAGEDKHRDMLPRSSLGVGGDLVDGASRFLAGYGKFIVPAIIIVVAAFAYFYYAETSGRTADIEMRNEIDRAAVGAEDLDELPGRMEGAIEQAKEDDVAVTYAYYRYALRAYELLEPPFKEEELRQVAGILEEYIELFGEVEEYEAWNQRIEGMQSTLAADLEFLTSDAADRFLPWNSERDPQRPEPEVVEGASPVVVFVTSVGEFEVELYEDDAGNAVSHFVSLCSEINDDGDAFYDRTEFSAASFSNHFSPSGPYKNSTVFTAGKEGRPVGVDQEEDDEADDDEEEDSNLEPAPYTIDYEGSTTERFREGSVAFVRDPDNPMRARTEFFVVIEPSTTLGVNFEPLGHITSEEGLDVARRLHNAEIYYTYVKVKREGSDYTPRVYYDGWPLATTKREQVPDPVRFSEIETEIVEDGNPVVVLELKGGDILIELFEDVAPNTVANFINLIEEGFYDSECEFYGVEGSATDIAEIYQATGERIIQGGFDATDTREGYDYGIRNEAVDNEDYAAFFGLETGGIANNRGTIAMERQEHPDSASTEFFINLKDHPEWDEDDNIRCVFGRVLYGIDLAAEVEKGDEILSAKVIRKRDHEYVPTVKYSDGDDYVEKEPVDLSDLLDS